MKSFLSTIAPVMMAALCETAGVPSLGAQITNQIRAHVNHSFMVGDKTIAPGEYTFRMEGNTDQGVMIVQNAKGDNVAEFSVRQSVDNRTPKHSELIFEKYGNTEFLTKIYEGGNQNGVAVAENSKEEVRLMKGGQHGNEHTEEQQ